MAQIKGINPVIVPRIPYVPIEPWDWFKENGLEDKMGGPPPMGAGPEMTPSVYIKDGKRIAGNDATLYGGDITDTTAEDVRIVSYDGSVGGIYAEGASTDFTVEGAVISLSGDGQGLGEKSAGAGVSDHAKLTLKDCLVDVNGLSRTATSASGGSVLKVYDSILVSHGAPYGADCPGEPPKMNPPAPLEIQGNNRTHCTVQNSYSYFYNSLITCDGWAALSTDASNGFVYLEANDCKVVATKSGYGAYADWGCHDVFNDCKFDVACQAAIVAGEASVKFTGCELKCGTYLSLMHCVMGRHTEVGELSLTDCDVKTGKTAIEVHGQNVEVSLDNCNIVTGGALMRTCKNADPNAARVNGRPTPGDELRMRDMTVTGDILHEDPERDCRVYMTSTCLTGAIQNAYVSMDQGSRWYATGDSNVILSDTVETAQIDAPAGVTIHAKAADGAGEYTLSSGGKLIVENLISSDIKNSSPILERNFSMFFQECPEFAWLKCRLPRRWHSLHPVRTAAAPGDRPSVPQFPAPPPPPAAGPDCGTFRPSPTRIPRSSIF